MHDEATKTLAGNIFRERVLQLRPLLEEMRDEGERERTLPRAVYRAFLDEGLFKLWVTKKLGGVELALNETLEVIEEVSRIDGSFGWSLAIALELSMVASRLPFDVAKEILCGNPPPVIAGSIHPLGRAAPVDGGHLVTGEWALASGCHHASWFAGNCLIGNSDENHATSGTESPLMRFFFMPIGACQILDTWDCNCCPSKGKERLAKHWSRVF